MPLDGLDYDGGKPPTMTRRQKIQHMIDMIDSKAPHQIDLDTFQSRGVCCIAGWAFKDKTFQEMGLAGTPRMDWGTILYQFLDISPTYSLFSPGYFRLVSTDHKTEALRRLEKLLALEKEGKLKPCKGREGSIAEYFNEALEDDLSSRLEFV